MANFEYAIERLFGLEGGYARHPADPGGETYRGISRRYHPEWSQWADIDRAVMATGEAKLTCCQPEAVSLVKVAEASRVPALVQRLPTWGPVLAVLL